MIKEELYSLYKKIINDEISEEELFYYKLKDEDDGIIDLGLMMKRNKEKYPSLIIDINDISSKPSRYCVYFNQYTRIHELMECKSDTEYNHAYEIFDGYIYFYDINRKLILTISKYEAYFTDKEDANKLLLHLKEKLGDKNV